MWNKITDFAVRVCDFGTKWAASTARLFRLPRLSSAIAQHFSKPASLVGLESFVALSLAVYYFFLILPMSQTVREYGNDIQTVSYFTEYSQHPFTKEDFSKDYPDVKTRLTAQLLTGWITDREFNSFPKDKPQTVSMGVWSYTRFSLIFAGYHTAWLLLLFGLLIRFRRDALLIILGVFSGLMFNVAWPSWQYFFPWDLPSMFFFTWAILTYDNSKSILPLIVVVWLGALFKETTLCCSLLILFGEHWSLRKRAIGFVVTIAAFSIAKKILLVAYAVPVDFFSKDNFFSGLRIRDNFADAFTNPGPNHVLFVNAGALLIMMLLPWRTYRQMLFKLVAAVFIAGIVLFARVIEFRVWYEILPLGWILISEAISKSGQLAQSATNVSGTSPPGFILDDRAQRALRGLGWMAAGCAAVLLAGTLAIASFSSPKIMPASAALNTSTNLNTDTNIIKSEPQPAPDLDNLIKFNNLAWALATNPEAKKRDGQLAVTLAERACDQTHYQLTETVGTLAAAYAEAGRFDDAIAMAQKACDLATASGNTALVKKGQELLALFREHQPYRAPVNPVRPTP